MTITTDEPAMSNASRWLTIEAAIVAATGEPLHAAQRSALAGGCINRAYRIADRSGRSYFVKLNARDRSAMFEAEAAGLRELANAGGPRVPRPLSAGVAGDAAFLVLEYLDLYRGDSRSGARLGAALARLHHHIKRRFGWDRDNTIGATPQPNEWCAEWVEFWRTRRLGPQIAVAERSAGRAFPSAASRRLLGSIEVFFQGYDPVASLLHGDLWAGNQGRDAHGDPVIYDPAVYFGDRETDIAMSELFGGFPESFYAAYRDAWPLDPGYPVRRRLYNLYHVLNHYNLFGGAYLAQASSMIDALLVECG